MECYIEFALGFLMQALCRVCGEQLTTKNCSPSYAKRRDRICRRCHAAQSRAWRRAHPDYGKEYRKKHKDTDLETGRRNNAKAKLETLQYYSGKELPQCADPFGIHVDHPFTIVDALTLDHIDGGGRKHMIQLFGYATGGRPFYRHLKREGWPPGYRVLCMNCQWIARRRGNHAA